MNKKEEVVVEDKEEGKLLLEQGSYSLFDNYITMLIITYTLS